MRGLPVSILLLMLMALTGAAQSAPRDLKISARVIASAISTETKVSVTFLNTSDHPLSFPRPLLFCQKLPGGMLVVSKFKPSDPNSEQLKIGTGCAACKGIGASEPDIVEQAKGWVVLGPGESIDEVRRKAGMRGAESIDVQEQLSKAMIIGDAGNYRFHVIYSAPSFDAHDRNELREAGILLPSSGDYDSDTVAFEIKQPQSDTP